ncbi:30S ribosomal protein THX [Adhaeribacter aquaticus]|nr:30S ribosomal protein THX [Adhaeribacter aquaticus]
MGKGDVKSKKGKIAKGSFGNSRKRRSKKNNTTKNQAPAAPAAAK